MSPLDIQMVPFHSEQCCAILDRIAQRGGCRDFHQR
jgi:hypothetical protein